MVVHGSQDPGKFEPVARASQFVQGIEHLPQTVQGEVFSLDEIIELLNQHPEITAINRQVQKLYEHTIQSATPVRLKDDTITTHSKEIGK